MCAVSENKRVGGKGVGVHGAPSCVCEGSPRRSNTDPLKKTPSLMFFIK